MSKSCCECEHENHFFGNPDYHEYGEEFPDLERRWTPYGAFEICEFCRENCYAAYIARRDKENPGAV